MTEPATPNTVLSSNDDPAREGQTAALPLLEEQVRVSKRNVVTGRVRVRTVVDTSEQIVQQDLATEHVTVTRVPIDRIVAAAPPIRTEGDVTIVPVLEEILVIETKLLLKEEIHIHRARTQETVEQAVTLRKQQAIIETDDNPISPNASDVIPKDYGS